MRWQTGISAASALISGVLMVIAGINYSIASDGGSSEAVVVYADGDTVPLDAVLGGGEVGVIDPAAQSEQPAPVSAETSLVPTASPVSSPACININTADQAQLVKLRGIGPAMSSNIIEYRAKHGPFKRLDDLKKVKGIGPAKFAGIVDNICL